MIQNHLTVTPMEYTGVKYLMCSMEKNGGICLFLPAAKRYLENRKNQVRVWALASAHINRPFA